MAQSIIHYKIFLASPGDVAEERESLEAVISELNLGFCKALNIHVELIKWETHAFPSIGIDAQDVISGQILKDYDIFIGIMWGRFGTPTGRAGSGTEEEFRNAYEKYKSGNSDLRIMFYFNSKPLSPHDLNTDQLRQVQLFRKELGQLGTLYWDYNGCEEFQSYVRLHLQQHLTELVRKNNSNMEIQVIKPETLAPIKNNEVDDNGELGYIEYMQLAGDGLNEVETITLKLTEDLEDLSNNLNHRAAKITQLKSMTHTNKSEVQRAMDKAADDMILYVDRTNVELPAFHDCLHQAINAFNRGFIMIFDSGISTVNDLEELENTLSGVNIVLNDNGKIFRDFRKTVKSLPPATQKVIKAKGKLDETIKNIIKEFSAANNLFTEFQKTVRKNLERLKDGNVNPVEDLDE